MKAAVLCYNRAIEILDPLKYDEAASLRYRCQLSVGLCFLKLDDPKKALLACTAIMNGSPQPSQAILCRSLYQRARALRRGGRLKHAIADLNDALAMKNHDPQGTARCETLLCQLEREAQDPNYIIPTVNLPPWPRDLEQYMVSQDRKELNNPPLHGISTSRTELNISGKGMQLLGKLEDRYFVEQICQFLNNTNPHRIEAVLRMLHIQNSERWSRKIHTWARHVTPSRVIRFARWSKVVVAISKYYQCTREWWMAHSSLRFIAIFVLWASVAHVGWL